jgi:hypothetical protein
MNREGVLYKIGDLGAEYTPRLSGIVTKTMVVGGGLLIGCELGEVLGWDVSAENSYLMAVGLIITPLGIALDKAREVAMRKRAFETKNISSTLELL